MEIEIGDSGVTAAVIDSETSAAVGVLGALLLIVMDRIMLWTKWIESQANS